MQRRRSIPKEIQKIISRRRHVSTRFVYDLKLGHFTLLFCSLNPSFDDIFFAVVVVVCLSPLISPLHWMDISLQLKKVALYDKAGSFVQRGSLYELNGRRVEIKRA